MMGLILKDIYTLKKQWKVMLVIFAFYFFISIMGQDAGYFSIMTVIYSFLLPITALAFDEQSHWDKYALALPLSRTAIVLSKYVLAIGINLVMTAITLIVNLAFIYYYDLEIIPIELLALTLGACTVGIIILAVMMPLFFKFGVEKARMVMIVVVLLPTVLIMLFPEFFASVPIAKIIPIIPLVVVALLCVSCFLSIKIYQHKEF